MTEQTIKQFLAATASGEPVPGGGSISALCGALAAALGHMMAQLTIGKKKYADVQPLMHTATKHLEPVVGTLLEAVRLDSEAYDQVFSAYKLPKDTDAERAHRAEVIQSAMKHAADVPLSVARVTSDILPDLLELARHGNRNAITDIYVATLCARTAILGATANTRINLTSITDPAYVAKAQEEIVLYVSKSAEAVDEVTRILDHELS